MKHLALSWVAKDAENLRKFDLVFRIVLNSVRRKNSIEEVIIAQHKSLKSRRVQPKEVRSILEGNTKQKVLILIDGHDEYKMGTNSDIDDAITKDLLPDCWIVLTSRDSKQLKKIEDDMDLKAEILGFDPARVEEYITKYLGSEEKCAELLTIAKNSGIINRKYSRDKGWHDHFGILCVPLLLHMICVLFTREVSLPRTRHEIISAIAERCPDWQEIRTTGKRTKKELEDALVKLGKFVFEKLVKHKSEPFQRVRNKPQHPFAYH